MSQIEEFRKLLITLSWNENEISSVHYLVLRKRPHRERHITFELSEINLKIPIWHVNLVNIEE
jgi:hypothetical protein